MGLLLRVVVHPADIQDRAGAKLLLDGIKQRFPRLSLIRADQGYSGPSLKGWLLEHYGCNLQIIQRPRRWGRYPADVEPPEMPAFQILPHRWIVERTFAWEGRNRRLAKDYEGLPNSEEAFVYLAMVRLMLRRLTR